MYKVTIQLILSYLFFPIAFFIGIPIKDCRKAAEFMASKMVINEFVAYNNLSSYALNKDFTNKGNFDDRSKHFCQFLILSLSCVTFV